jgi:nitroreductase
MGITAQSLTGAEVEAMAEAARRAPSIHNTQPWRFRALPDGLEVRSDPARALPVIDPHGRERVISCGAAAFNALVAIQALGHAGQVQLCPDPADAELIAVVRCGRPTAALPETARLAAEIPRRRTHRRVYRSHVIAESDQLTLRRAVAAQGARLEIADPVTRRRLAQLIRRALRAQLEDPELRAEIERWVRRGGSEAGDGIPLPSLGTSPFPVDSLAHAGHRDGIDPGQIEEDLARSTVLAILTRDDGRYDWSVAGMALERLLLEATAGSFVATFADQPLQREDLRVEATRILGGWGQPQVLLRIGRPLVDVPLTPRRPLAELWL